MNFLSLQCQKGEHILVTGLNVVIGLLGGKPPNKAPFVPSGKPSNLQLKICLSSEQKLFLRSLRGETDLYYSWGGQSSMHPKVVRK